MTCMKGSCDADTMMPILNVDKNMAYITVATTENDSSSAAGGGRPKGATKFAFMSLATKIKHCYQFSVETLMRAIIVAA